MGKFINLLLAILLIATQSNFVVAHENEYFNVSDNHKIETLTHSDLQQGYDLTRALPKNHKKDGSVDYRDQIQNALNKNRVVIFPNFPVLINDKGLTIGSNSTIIFQPNSKIILQGSSKPKYEILRLHNVSNVQLIGVRIEGDKYRHRGRSGEFGNGISLRNAHNILIRDAEINRCWGDGIIVGSFNDKECSNIQLLNIKVDDNRRNGLSITCVRNLLVDNLLASNTNGTIPMSGICIEPNSNNEIIDDVKIRNSRTEDNERCGIQIGLGKQPGVKAHVSNITIENYTDVNSKIGLYLGSYRDRYPKGKRLRGLITLKNINLLNNEESLKTGYNFHHGPQIEVIGMKIKNTKQNQSFESIRKKLKSQEYSSVISID